MEGTLGSTSQLPKLVNPKSTGKNLGTSFAIDPLAQRAELELYKRDLEEKDKIIKALDVRVDEYTRCCNQIHDFILRMEEITHRSFFTDEQRSKTILITHIEYAQLLRKSLSTLVEIHKGLQGRFASSFSEKATKISEEITSIRDEILDIEKKKKDANEEINKLMRLADIHQKEKESLHRILGSIDSQTKQLDLQANMRVSSIKDQINRVHLDIDAINQETTTLDKKYTKMLEQPKYIKGFNTKHDDFIIEREIVAMTRRYEHDCSTYESDLREYTHVINELKRGRQHLEMHKSALTRDRINAAEKLNQELRLYIESERVNDAKKLDMQIKKNRDLEKQLNETKEELATLKPHLQQLEKKYLSQVSRLPSLNPRLDQNSSPGAHNQKSHAHDDNEILMVKRALAKIRGKKGTSKSDVIPKSTLR